MRGTSLSTVKQIAQLVLLSGAIFFSGCATAPRHYLPPDATKMNASRQRLGQAVEKSRATASRAKSQVIEAQNLSSARNEKLAALKKQVPKELVPAVEDIEAASQQQDAKLAEAVETQIVLESQLTEADNAKIQHEKDDLEYQGKAGGLADTATSERNARIKAENSLSWYRWHWFLSWIIAGIGVAVCILIAVLKFTGRLAIAGSKL